MRSVDFHALVESDGESGRADTRGIVQCRVRKKIVRSLGHGRKRTCSLGRSSVQIRFVVHFLSDAHTTSSTGLQRPL